eukprot:g23492.t1
MPSAICSVHGVFWLTVLAGIAMAIVDGTVLQTWWIIPVALLAPLLFVFSFTLVICVAPMCGCFAMSSRLQTSLVQHPEPRHAEKRPESPGRPDSSPVRRRTEKHLLSRLTLPWITVIQGLHMCDNAYCQRIRASMGKNYVLAGMVGVSDYETVAFTLKSAQHRTDYLGAQPLTNLPKAKELNHDKFVACFYHYMFREGFEERLKSEKAKKCWAQLAEERTGRGEQFYTEDATGLRGFFIRYFFYVMLGTDTEDPEIMKDLVAMMRGDTPIAMCYLWPFAVPNLMGSTIKKVDDRIFNSSSLAKFVEGEEKFANMTKLELTRLTTCIMRLAAITGTLQLAKSVTGGLTMPPFEDMDKTNVAAEWDKLDLADEQALQNFCLEVARLHPPVSSEAFSATIQGRVVDFPAGTKILVPTNLAMTDVDTWGVDAFKFNPSRPALQEKNMVFANVGKQGTRVCPGQYLAMDTCVEILRVLGKVRREGK